MREVIMTTNENALREQGENKNVYFKTDLNFTTNRGLIAYENLRRAWVTDNLNHTEHELIETCKLLAKACGLKLTNDHKCLWEFNHVHH